MAKRGIAMHRLREMLRLHYELGLSDRAIGRAQNLSHLTVGNVIKRFESEGGCWPLAEDITDSVLHRWLYPGNLGRPKARPEPDWATVHRSGTVYERPLALAMGSVVLSSCALDARKRKTCSWSGCP